jgi:Family of unknown function (DUF6130)
MTMLIKTLATVAAGTVLATNTLAQSAKEVVGATPYVAIENEPPPKVVVDPPLPDQLARGVVEIQYRVENLHIVPVFGAAALNVSPRVGHLHVTVDDLPWHWTDPSGLNTIAVVGLPPGQHKVLIELANGVHQVFTGCACTATVMFTVPDAAMTHEGSGHN